MPSLHPFRSRAVVCTSALFALAACHATNPSPRHELRAPHVAAETTAADITATDTTTADLTAELQARCANFRGRVGIYAHHLPSDTRIAIDADSVYPTASMIKVPILVTLFDQLDHQRHDYHAKLTYTVDRLYAGEDLLGAFADGQAITLDKLVFLMITMSDNTASLWLQEQVGTGTAINDWLAAHGFEHTRVNSRTEGREDARSEHGWGQTTPREMAKLLRGIVAGDFASADGTAEMRRVLSRTYWDDTAISVLPIEVAYASKQGAVSQSRSEVVFVHAPGGDYVFCVITDDQIDRSWGDDNEGAVLIRDVARSLWESWGRGKPAGS